jgi:8-oxo-dGTP pyrophosphatase MutT (NUDIX family)
MTTPTSRTLSSETLFTGRVFSVARERVRLPHGTEATLDIVRHPGSVVLLPMPDDETIILVRQYRHAVGRHVWEVPAGTIGPGEDAVDAARRECHEEVGLWPEDVTKLASLYPSPGYTDEVMHYYLLRQLRTADDESARDDDEHLDVQHVPVGDVAAWVADGRIVDMKTVVGIQLLTHNDRTP